MKKTIYMFRLPMVLLCCVSLSLFIACSPVTKTAGTSSEVSMTISSADGIDETLSSDQPWNHDVYNPALSEGKLSVWFLGLQPLGMKNNDSTLARFPDGSVLLIDTGGSKVYPELETQLHRIGITQIDFLLLTHFHEDHVGALAKLLDLYPVGQAFLPDFGEDWPRNALSIVGELEERSIPVQKLSAGMEVLFCREVSCLVLHPDGPIRYPEGLLEGKSTTVFENNNSVVFQLQYGDTKFLFTGDIYADMEYFLVERYGDKLKSTILKVPHHGLSTSSSFDFLFAVMPDVAVVMSGEPTESTLNSLRNKADTYVTGAYGTVLVVSDGHDCIIYTEHDGSTNVIYG